MPREEAQEAAKLLFINAEERTEQVERVEDYRVQTLCWLPMQQETQLLQELGTSPPTRWIRSPIAGPSQVRNWSPTSQPWSESEEQGWKPSDRGTNRDWPGVNYDIHRLSAGRCQSYREVTHKGNQRFSASNYVKWKWRMEQWLTGSINW